ncbi:MAG TPA: TonB-dependent receptor [Vicinamibacterales bacterium]|nr:TonB-dependent receptor [Vicinamibacterales bacterium]
MWRRLGSVVLVAAAWLLFLPIAAYAQSAFSGVVHDPSGAVLPGVTVEVASPVLIEKTRSVVTDGAGRYTIVDLRPGTYSMTFTLTGFATVVRDGVELPGNTTVPINVELKVGSIEESVTVSGQSPLVDVQNAQRTHVLERSVLDALPTTRNMQTVGAPIPGVKLSRPDVGGSQGMEQAYMRTHGADDRHTSMQVDGMIVNSSMGDGNIQAYNDDALAQQVVFQTSALPAEVASGGVRVNMIPKDGGNTFRGGGFIGGTAHGWQSDNNDDALRARGFLYRNFVQHVQDFNVNMGGPIVRDKLWFFTTARHVSVDEGVANTYYRVPYQDHQVGDPAIQEQFVRDALVRLTTQLTPRNKLSAYMERIWKFKDPELAPNVDPVTASDIRDWRHALYYVGQVKYTSTLTSKLLLEAGYSTNIERLSQRYQPAIEEIANHPFTPEWYTQVTHSNATTANVTGAAPGGSTGTYPDRKVFSGSLSYVSGSHALKTGMQWSFGVDGNSQLRTGDLVQNYILNAAGVETPNSVTVYNTPTRYYEYVNGDIGIYAQDVWTMRRLTLSPGVRYDHFNAKTEGGCRTAGRFVAAFCQPDVPDVPNWNNLSPRFSAVYDLFGDSKTALKASVSKYMLPWAGGWAKRYDPFTTVSETRNWTDLNRDNIAQDNEIGPSGNANFGISTGRSPAPGLAREYNVETTVGFQHQLLPRLALYGGYYHRHFYNQEAQQNPLLTLDDWTPFQVANPTGNGETLTLFNLDAAKAGLYSKQLIDINSSINRTIYDGFEVSFNARLPRGANVFGGWSNDRLMTITCDQYDPNKLRFCDQTGETFQQYGATSKPPFRNDFKLSANYPLPWNIEVSGVFISFAGKGNSYTAQDPSLGVYWTVPASVFPNGQRTRAVVSAPILLAAGTQTQAPGLNLISPNSKFEPRWNQLDLSAKRTFRFQRKEIQGQIAVFNALNANTVLQEVQSFGSSLGQPQNVLQGRMMRLAVLFNF